MVVRTTKRGAGLLLGGKEDSKGYDGDENQRAAKESRLRIKKGSEERKGGK
jgi:hypothetical protein